MKYMLLIYTDESRLAALSAEEQGLMMQAYGAYTQALSQAGATLGGDRLRPSATATSVRVRDGKADVLHGPYAETLEQLGGYYLIDAPDLDVALSWATRCPGSAYGTVEVRPVWEM